MSQTNKKNIRKCRYCYCKVNNGLIDVSIDDYSVDGKRYFHKECYELKNAASKETEKDKKNFQIIKDLWYENIDREVIFWRLVDAYNDLLKTGEESDYLVFALQYCINNRLHLHYPAGFHWFVESGEIRDAYARKKVAEMKKNAPFVSKETEDTSPKFSVNAKKQTGFGGILGKR